MRQQVRRRRESQALDRRRLVEQALCCQSACCGKVGGFASRQFRVIQGLLDQRMTLVERLAMPRRQRAERQRQLVGVAGVLHADQVGGQLQDLALVEATRAVGRGPQQPSVVDDRRDPLRVGLRDQTVEQ